ncbi:hypothetical protein [Hyphomicrobium sp. D-2]|uniref:hypothetical protein n=1 Tax=Hyphomicrobium sp. D-2 TaxID=3041621 RepID=UPI002453DD1E|nr:hypothetical protein [Hyphomicrobium sp. D-2]MDH4982676.1 hypothetical protein [Hyphomicrobium sp. D-2]
MHVSGGLAVALLTAAVVLHGGAVLAAPKQPYASDAHRPGAGGYGVMKSRTPTIRSPGIQTPGIKRPDTSGGARREPYDYRYYSDRDRSPSSCRRYAQRAIATKNSNWWTRYRACLQ